MGLRIDRRRIPGGSFTMDFDTAYLLVSHVFATSASAHAWSASPRATQGAAG